MSQLRNLVKKMLPLPDEVKDDEGNIQIYEERKANNEAIRLYYEQAIKDLMLELVDSCEEYESDLGSDLVFDQNLLRQRIEAL